MQDCFLDDDDDDDDADLDGNESLDVTAEDSNYCHNNYGPDQDEIDEFRDSSRQAGKFKRSLFCPQGVENSDSFYYVILYDLLFKNKNSKGACETDDQLRQDIESDKLYEALSKAKLDLRLDLDLQNLENQCYFANSLLNENNLFLRVYELKDKFRYLIKQESEKEKILRELSACVVEKFNGFNIVRAAFDKKLRRLFRPVDILYAPAKKADQLVNCFLSAKLNPMFRVSCSDGSKSNKVKRSTAWQCYFCLNYYAPKERYDHHIKNCAGCCCCVYNFNTQSLLTFEENLKFKGDIPLVPYIDF